MTTPTDATVPPEVLQAFACEGNPRRLTGGEGRSYRVGDTVLKPVDDVIRYAWTAALTAQLHNDSFRISQARRTRSGALACQGWGATVFEPGAEIRGRWDEKLAVCRDLHRVMAGVMRIPLPDSDDQWTQAHAIAWQEVDPPQALHADTHQLLAPVFGAYAPMARGGDVIHSDMCGNVLFAEDLPPLVIDFSPARGVADYADAILVADAIAWEQSPITLLDALPLTHTYRQLLLRAVAFRVITIALLFPQTPERARSEFDHYAPIVQQLS